METTRQKQQRIFRQGDVIIEAIDPRKAKCNFKPLTTHTLAEGEQTGHHHSFRHQDQVLVYQGEQPSSPTKYLQVLSGEAVLEHQEHLPIHIPEGTYEVRIQKEYNPFLDRMTQVHD